MLLLFINCSVKIKVLTESSSDKFWLFRERRCWGRDLAVLLEKTFWSPGVLAQDMLAWEINHGIWLLRPLALQVLVGDKASTVLKRYMEKKHTFKWKLEVFVGLCLIPSERSYCFCRATDWVGNIPDLSWCVFLKWKLCWLITQCRVSMLVLEICLLKLIRSRCTSGVLPEWWEVVNLQGVQDLWGEKPRAEQCFSSVNGGSDCTAQTNKPCASSSDLIWSLHGKVSLHSISSVN